ncbi:MAG: 3'-5' exonuclease, partial [Chloroflexi bacterium]
IPSEVVSIHGITDAMVADAPEWGDVYPTVRRILSAGSVVVYNADFDYRMLNQMNARYGFPHYQARWECAMHQYGAWAGQWNAKYGNYRWHKLDSALTTFGHPIASHRAADDARACRLVVVGMAQTTNRR